MIDENAARILSNVRAEIDELERLLSARKSTVSSDLPTFDPDTDTPTVRPKAKGNDLEENWCCLVLWAKLRAINVRQGRGATRDESVAIAKAAGYQDGRGWNRWDGWTLDDSGNRWASGDGGVGNLHRYYAAVGRAIPQDLDA